MAAMDMPLECILPRRHRDFAFAASDSTGRSSVDAWHEALRCLAHRNDLRVAIQQPRGLHRNTQPRRYAGVDAVIHAASRVRSSTASVADVTSST